MKKHFIFISLMSTISIFGQIYTPTGTVNGFTTNPSTDYIGIGTNSPSTKLDVMGDIRANENFISGGNNSWVIHTPDDGRTTIHIAPRNNSNTDWEWNNAFIIQNNGNASLSGKFEAKEIKVTLTPTADFVFEEDYNLPKLEEVEKHIKEKKHLPEIASAKEMEKKGVNVGEFQIKLLQKIEELTLYIIEQNNRIKELETKVNHK